MFRHRCSQTNSREGFRDSGPHNRVKSANIKSEPANGITSPDRRLWNLVERNPTNHGTLAPPSVESANMKPPILFARSPKREENTLIVIGYSVERPSPATKAQSEIANAERERTRARELNSVMSAPERACFASVTRRNAREAR